MIIIAGFPSGVLSTIYVSIISLQLFKCIYAIVIISMFYKQSIKYLARKVDCSKFYRAVLFLFKSLGSFEYFLVLLLVSYLPNAHSAVCFTQRPIRIFREFKMYVCNSSNIQHKNLASTHIVSELLFGTEHKRPLLI